MVIGTRKEKFWGVLLGTLFIFGFAYLYPKLSTNSDPYLFEHEEKSYTFHVSSFFRGETSFNQIERNFSHKIVNSTEILIFCNMTTSNYFVFKISLNIDSYDVLILYENLNIEDPSAEYTDLAYDVDSELALISKDIAGDYVNFLSIEASLIISS